MYNKTLFGTVPQIPAADPPLDLTPSSDEGHVAPDSWKQCQHTGQTVRTARRRDEKG